MIKDWIAYCHIKAIEARLRAEQWKDWQKPIRNVPQDFDTLCAAGMYETAYVLFGYEYIIWNSVDDVPMRFTIPRRTWR